MMLIRPFVVTDAALLSCNIPETDYTAFNLATTYGLGDRVRVIGANVHRVYESLQAGNVGHDPAASPTWWLEVGPTNRWKLFDSSVTSQATNPDLIDVTLHPTGRIDSLALLNLAAQSVRVIMTDAVDGVVYDKTFSLVSDSGVHDWYAYFYEPIDRRSDLVIYDMPPYHAPTIQVIVSDPGFTVAVGAMVLGFKKIIGGTQYGVRVGIQDYSVKKRDDFGNYTVLERAFNKNATFTLFVDANFVDQLHALLASYRATPIVYAGTDIYSSTVIYGFYKDFSITIAYPTESICTLEIEGLT
ncbi:hypothetical protein A1507_19885 [Methylomonas koyamae]|uniref:Carbohydrate-binding protein n=1 Tax=Methylomonas koyamae TaxID=702114 RepID=A0A177N3S8_9GAMM|nr:hypothetical protein [Methylomonas koyamae]OAI11790.1 hypothetical protein A1507_19885 [Methylomonas koyamae]